MFAGCVCAIEKHTYTANNHSNLHFHSSFLFGKIIGRYAREKRSGVRLHWNRMMILLFSRDRLCRNSNMLVRCSHVTVIISLRKKKPVAQKTCGEVRIGPHKGQSEEFAYCRVPRTRSRKAQGAQVRRSSRIFSVLVTSAAQWI